MQKIISYERSLEKFNPLSRVIFYDDFDLGFNGWQDLTPNFVRDNFRQQASPIDLGSWAPSMISAAPMRFAAAHGSLEGTYSLKLGTRDTSTCYEDPPEPGSMGIVVKRVSRSHTASRYIQIEAWYSYSAFQDRVGTGEEAVRAFGVFFDIQDSEYRWQPGVRYVNSANGNLVKRWQFAQATEGMSRRDWCHGVDGGWEDVGIDGLWSGKRYGDGSTDAFQWMPNGEQSLVYNESPDKLNWLYLRLTVDLHAREYVELQSMDRVIDLRGISPTCAETYDGIFGLINPVFFIETDTARIVNLYLDSVVFSEGPTAGKEADTSC